MWKATYILSYDVFELVKMKFLFIMLVICLLITSSQEKKKSKKKKSKEKMEIKMDNYVFEGTKAFYN